MNLGVDTLTHHVHALKTTEQIIDLSAVQRLCRQEQFPQGMLWGSQSSWGAPGEQSCWASIRRSNAAKLVWALTPWLLSRNSGCSAKSRQATPLPLKEGTYFYPLLHWLFHKGPEGELAQVHCVLPAGQGCRGSVCPQDSSTALAALCRASTSLLSKETALDLALNPLPLCREGTWLPAQSEQHLGFHTCAFSSTLLPHIHPQQGPTVTTGLQRRILSWITIWCSLLQWINVFNI